MVRIWLGDTQTGRAWAEENDVIGTIGRSTGTMEVPLLVEAGELAGPHLPAKLEVENLGA